MRSGLCGFLCSFALGKRLQALREFVSLFDEVWMMCRNMTMYMSSFLFANE